MDFSLVLLSDSGSESESDIVSDDLDTDVSTSSTSTSLQSVSCETIEKSMGMATDWAFLKSLHLRQSLYRSKFALYYSSLVVAFMLFSWLSRIILHYCSSDLRESILFSELMSMSSSKFFSIMLI